MNPLRHVVVVLAFTSPFLDCQSAYTAIPGVEDPPELAGPGKKFTPPDPVLKEFAIIFQPDTWKESDPAKMKEVSDRLTSLLVSHPEVGIGYMMRLTSTSALGKTDPALLE